MIHFILSTLWDSAWAQFGLAGLVLIAAVAAFLFLGDVPGMRHIAIGVATPCIIFLFLGPKLYIEGVRYEKAKWDAAEAAAVRRATDARTQAEAEIAAEQPPKAPDAQPVVSGGGRGIARILHPKRVRNDRYDRDNAR